MAAARARALDWYLRGFSFAGPPPPPNCPRCNGRSDFELAWEAASLITRYNSQYAREYSVTQALENILLLSLEIVELVIIAGFFWI